VVASTETVGTFTDRSREVIELLTTTAEATLDRVESAENLRRRDRRLREQETRLGHLERTIDLIESIDRALVDAESREDAEAAVLDCLVEDGEFDFAWIGGVDAGTGELTPREWTDGGGSTWTRFRWSSTTATNRRVGWPGSGNPQPNGTSPRPSTVTAGSGTPSRPISTRS